MLISLETRNLRPADLTVSEVMSAPVVSCDPNEELALALSTMREQKIRRLPVVGPDGSGLESAQLEPGFDEGCLL